MPDRPKHHQCTECGGGFYSRGRGVTCQPCKIEKRRLAGLRRIECSTPAPGQSERIEAYCEVIARGGRLFETRSTH